MCSSGQQMTELQTWSHKPHVLLGESTPAECEDVGDWEKGCKDCQANMVTWGPQLNRKVCRKIQKYS